MTHLNPAGSVLIKLMLKFVLLDQTLPAQVNRTGKEQRCDVIETPEASVSKTKLDFDLILFEQEEPQNLMNSFNIIHQT